ncbi:MAG: hypothetical protein WBD99_16525 [Thermodesulfobacteriota bacterium]
MTQKVRRNHREPARYSSNLPGGRRASQAEKKHYANRLYATEDAALADLPHPGARPRIVMVTTSRSRFNELFDNGRILVADLRDF